MFSILEAWTSSCYTRVMALNNMRRASHTYSCNLADNFHGIIAQLTSAPFGEIFQARVEESDLHIFEKVRELKPILRIGGDVCRQNTVRLATASHRNTFGAMRSCGSYSSHRDGVCIEKNCEILEEVHSCGEWTAGLRLQLHYYTFK